MLAIVRALAAQPRLLLLDEPSEGLAPAMVKAIHDAVVGMRVRGISLLLVEQNLPFALALGDASSCSAAAPWCFAVRSESCCSPGRWGSIWGLNTARARCRRVLIL